MPDTPQTNQLPLRTTSSSRWPRKWATIGGRGASSSSTTMIPTNGSESTENSSKTTENHRHSTSLIRHSSTRSRNNDKSSPSTENLDPSLKKSRSLMNVIRSKFNSPAVLRRFRSKSRENPKQTVTEINGHINDEKIEIKQSTDELETTRKPRKRDPSPIKRFTSCISQLTRHQRAKSIDRQQQSPSKTIIDDSQNEIIKKPPVAVAPPPAQHNQDKVDRINACYDEIRAKYFNDTDNKKRTITNEDNTNRSISTISINGSLRSNDFFNTNHRVPCPIISDDPLLQARKQSNIKLNCLLSGYTLTKSFANHEKLFGQNDLFKCNHFYDVGRKKFEWNYTNANNRLYSSMRTKPISKSIDNFRHTTRHDNEVSDEVEKTNIVNNDILVQKESYDEDIRRILPTDNELVIREDSDLMNREQNLLHHSSNVDTTSNVPLNGTTDPATSSNLSDENNNLSTEHRPDDTDEEFERSFLRAVNRALGVAYKDENNSTEVIYDKPNENSELNLNFTQITEQAISSLNSSNLLTSANQTNELSDENNSTEITNVESVDSPSTNEPLNIEDLSSSVIINENQQETSNEDFTDECIRSVIDDLLKKTEDLLLFEENQNGRTFLAKLDEQEKTLKSKADAYNKLLQSNDKRLTEEVRMDIHGVVGEVNLLLKGKLQQFRGLCERNIKKSPGNEPIPLDSDLEGFWDMTYPLIEKIKEKFAKLDARKAKNWATIQEYDPNDVNNRPRVVDDRLKAQQNKAAKPAATRGPNDDLKKLIQERRKAAANNASQNEDVEIFIAQK